MKYFQGWRVKLYAFITLSLFVIGATAAAWPQSTVTFNEGSLKGKVHVKTVSSMPKDEVKIAGNVSYGGSQADADNQGSSKENNQSDSPKVQGASNTNTAPTEAPQPVQDNSESGDTDV